jgi:hypothetical protein
VKVQLYIVLSVVAIVPQLLINYKSYRIEKGKKQIEKENSATRDLIVFTESSQDNEASDEDIRFVTERNGTMFPRESTASDFNFSNVDYEETRKKSRNNSY